jgi:hypothetical protein
MQYFFKKKLLQVAQYAKDLADRIEFVQYIKNDMRRPELAGDLLTYADVC